MEAQMLLIKIVASRKAEDIFSIRNYQQEYTDMVKLLHPDVCHLPLAGEAVAKLNLYRKEMDRYSKGEDDAGSFMCTAENEVVFTGDANLLQRSYQHYQMLMNLKDDSVNHFKKYLPQSMAFLNNELIVKSTHRMLPLTHLVLPHQHTDWILSRIYELISWLHQTGYCHLGINPESVFIVPETHGIVCLSFYHLTPVNTKPESISGRYINWYSLLDAQEGIRFRRKAYPGGISTGTRRLFLTRKKPFRILISAWRNAPLCMPWAINRAMELC